MTRGNIGLQSLAQLPGILVGQIDRVLHAVQSKFDGTVGIRPVKVIGQNGDDLRGHAGISNE
jgi:hypothetical protein